MIPAAYDLRPPYWITDAEPIDGGLQVTLKKTLAQLDEAGLTWVTLKNRGVSAPVRPRTCLGERMGL